MEQSKYDLAKAFSQIQTSSKSAASFLDVLGADVDSSFTQPLQHAVTASTAEISIGGQTINAGGSNLQIQIADEGILLDICKTCVVYDLEVNDNLWVQNFLTMWRPYQTQIGNITQSVANGDYLLQAYTYQRSKKSFKNYALGLGLNIASAPFLPQFDGLATSYAETAIAIKASTPIHDFYAAQTSFCTKIKGDGVFKCVISLADMWPWLRESFPEGKMALQLGQKLVCNAQLLPSSKWLHQRIAKTEALDFKIKNALLVKSYTMLDAERQGLVLKSTVPLMIHRYLSVQQPLATSVVFNYALAANEKVKRLFVSCQYVNDILKSGDAGHNTFQGEARVFGAEAAGNNTIAIWKGNAVIANIAKAIQLIQIQFGGQVRTYTLQQSPGILGYGLGAIESQMLFYADDAVGSSLHAPLVLDMTRFGINDDLFGSSAGNHLAMQVMIQLIDGQKIVPGAADSILNIAGQSGYQLHTWIETCAEGSCQQGIYTVKGPLA